MAKYDFHLSQKLGSDHFVSILRVTLGVIFVIGGLKLAIPTLFGIADVESLAQSYIDPTRGWISPLFAQRITQGLGISIGTFLQIQGLIEMVMGLTMICGVFTPMVAVTMGCMFWSFTIASPIAGEIRLSRDLALMGLCFAVAVSGASTWSIDSWRRQDSKFRERRNLVLVMVRLSLAFTLVVSAIFSGGILNNPLNTTLPVLVVFGLGVALAVGLVPRWLMVLIGLWMIYLITTTLWVKGWLPGLDSIKREIGLFAGGLLYAASGPDRWSYPRPKTLQCSSVVELTMHYLEGTLEHGNRRAFEHHLADCSNCWRFLKTYQETVDLGRSLREDDIPPEMTQRLQSFVGTHLQRP